MEHGPNCAGQLIIVAAILEAPFIEKILVHLGLQARGPPRAVAGGRHGRPPATQSGELPAGAASSATPAGLSAGPGPAAVHEVGRS